MQDSKHYAPNPLRPYYIPPSIGTDPLPNATSSASKPATQGSSFSFPNIDYSDYIPEASPSLTGSIKSFIDQALWKYTGVVLGQPFEVAKIILQARVAQDHEEGEKPTKRDPYRDEEEAKEYDDEDANSSDDEPNYFTSNAPFERPFSSRSPARGRRGRPSRGSDSPRTPGRRELSDGRIHLKNPHSLLEALSALSSSGGGLAMWRATNSTFVYNILARTLETFFKGFLAAVFGIAENDILATAMPGAIPDISILNSTTPAVTILVSTMAAAMSALILAPIDAARTRLILTPSSQEPRTLVGTLQTLPTAYLPARAPHPHHIFDVKSTDTHFYQYSRGAKVIPWTGSVNKPCQLEHYNFSRFSLRSVDKVPT